MAFYPTYEEWKLPFTFISYEYFYPFYPTYEEWKLCSPPHVRNSLILFILPMRNGNLSNFLALAGLQGTFYPTYEEWKHGTYDTKSCK